MPERTSVARIADDLPRYQTVIDRAKTLQVWHLVGLLQAPKPARRVSHLKRLLEATAQSPQGQSRLYDADWQKLDGDLKVLAELLMAAVQDVYFLPLTNKRFTGDERDAAILSTLRKQAELAMECLDRLPKDGAGFAREVDMGDVHMHEVKVKIYEQTRQVFFDKLAEAAQWKGLNGNGAAEYLSYLVENLGGQYGNSAGHALRSCTYLDSRLEFFVLQKLQRKNLGMGGESQKTYRAYAARVACEMPAEQFVAFSDMQLAIGKKMPRCGLEVLLAAAYRLERVLKVIDAFTGEFGIEWKVDAMDATELTATLTSETNVTSLSSAKFRLEQKLGGWSHPDDEIEVTFQLRERLTDKVLFKKKARPNQAKAA